jgi:dTDP-4-amino-4,6-dideoxygalactose transaminase
MSKRLIRLSKSIVGATEADAIRRVLIEDGYLGMGKETQLFEKEIGDFLGVPGEAVTCVNSGTAALHLSVQAVVDPGEEVLVQSLTFLSSFQAISATGAVPVPCEINVKNLTIDIEDARRRMTTKTRAIMPVHYASNPGNLDEIYDFARNHGLRVIEDAAHAFGCTYKKKMIGSFGDITCFSFDGIKNITSGEGGAIITEDEEVRNHVRDARLLGVQKDTEKRYKGERSWEFDVTHQGYRYHLSNVLAAIGRVQLKRFDKEFKPRRIELSRRYRSTLRNVPRIELIEGEPGEIVPHIFPVRVLNRRRDTLRQFLIDKGVECGIHYKPNHLLSFYGVKKGMLPKTERLYDELMSLPLHPGLSDAEADYVIENIKEFFQKGGMSIVSSSE